jgi:hypothetical protein
MEEEYIRLSALSPALLGFDVFPALGGCRDKKT